MQRSAEKRKEGKEADSMSEHELIIPNKGFQFKIFEFEGKGGGYFRERHWHRSIEIFAVYEGYVNFEVNERKLCLRSGEFILINSNEVHSIESPEPNSTVVVQFPLKVFEDYYNDDAFIYFTHSPRNEDQEIMRLILRLYREIQQEEYGFTYKVQSEFFYLLYLLVVKYRKKEVSPEIRVRYQKLNYLSSIIDYIYEHFQENVSLRELSEKFGYSPAYLSRMFQKYAQIGYKTYLQSVRIEFAFRELVNTDHTVSEVALNNGFPSGKSFSREFKKKYNMLPTEYRRRMAESDAI